MWTIFKRSLLTLLQYCFHLVFGFCGLQAYGILASWPGVEPTPPPFEGEVLTPGPPGKSQDVHIHIFFFRFSLLTNHRLIWNCIKNPETIINSSPTPHSGGMLLIIRNHENWKSTIGTIQSTGGLDNRPYSDFTSFCRCSFMGFVFGHNSRLIYHMYRVLDHHRHI